MISFEPTLRYIVGVGIGIDVASNPVQRILGFPPTHAISFPSGSMTMSPMIGFTKRCVGGTGAVLCSVTGGNGVLPPPLRGVVD